MGDKWNYSKRARLMKSSIIREILKITNKPGIISFAGGLPAPELFPKKELAEACKRVLEKEGDNALQYSLTEGYYPLREYITQRMKNLGVDTTPDEILITGGSQQGLDLTGKVFLDIGDVVITTSPTYLGAIQAFNAYHPTYHTFPSDDNGMLLDGLEEAVNGKDVRLVYLVPTFQNPDGRTLSLERREKIIDICSKHAIPIIEDDPYSELVYTGTIPPLMKSLSKDNVILLGTFSKLLAPGLRIAWLIADEEVRDKYVKLKQGIDLHTNTFAQYVIYEYAKDGALDDHIKKIKECYSKRRIVMLDAMEKYFPEEVFWTKPTGGMFLWVELPKNINTTELLNKAVQNSVAYIPGSAFFPAGGGENSCRLNFSKPSESEIEVGIERLSDVFKNVLVS